MMVETGKMHLIETQAGEPGPVCIFETETSERFGVSQPAISAEQEAAVLQTLREILEDEGLME
jgi:hypothetical protein